jgi:hypothetical protein
MDGPMMLDASFEALWATIQRQGTPGTVIPNWTRDSEAIGDDFSIVRVTATAVHVTPPKLEVTRNDFAKVFELWPGYVAGRVQRSEIRDMTQRSKYIISILHWLETRAGG